MNTRTFFILILLLLGFLIYMEWQRDYAPPRQPTTEQPPADLGDPLDPARADIPSVADAPDLPDVPDFEDRRVDDPERLPAPEIRASRRIEISTDVLSVDLDANGGTLVDLRLKDYPVSVDRPDEPFTLLVEELPELFVAQAGLLSAASPAPNHRSRWEFEHDYYELAEGQDRLEVPLTWRDDSGLEVVATWIFHRGDYVVDLDIEVINRSGEEWRGARYVQLQRTRPDFSDAGWAFTNPERFSYNGAAVFSPEDALKKISWSDIESRPFEGTFDQGWAAMIQHYFVTAWIPPADQRHRYTTRHVTTERLPRYILAATSPQVSVPDGDSYRFNARLYAGPKLQNRLDEIAPGLRLTVDYRWFRILSQPLFWVLDKIHMVIQHWGLVHRCPDPADQAAVLQAHRGPVPFHGQAQETAAAHPAAQGALRRRPAEVRSGHDGDLQEGEGQSARRLPAHPGPDPDLHLAVLGAARIGGTPPDLVFVGAGS
jgi:YidC/Oxa1 family membrane protein insertase